MNSQDFKEYMTVIKKLFNINSNFILYDNITFKDFLKACDIHMGWQIPIINCINVINNKYLFKDNNSITKENVIITKQHICEYLSNFIKLSLNVGYTYN